MVKSTTTNRFGIGVLTDLTSYNNVDARIDVDKMDQDIRKAIASTTLTGRCHWLLPISGCQGERLMAVLQTTDDKYPPFGAEVTKSKGIGMVMEEGLVYIGGVNLNESLNVIWNGKHNVQLPFRGNNRSLKTSNRSFVSGSLTNKINNER